MRRNLTRKSLRSALVVGACRATIWTATFVGAGAQPPRFRNQAFNLRLTDSEMNNLVEYLKSL